MLKMALFCVIFTTIFKIDREICTLVMDELVLFENCKNITGFLRIRDVNPSTVHNA